MAYRILHVDDDPDIRTLVEFSLQLDPRLAVTSCSSGEEALLASANLTPDLILCDVMMPRMDGPTLLARVRENSEMADTPFVFMTARAQTVEVDKLKSLGAAGLIAKPFDPMKLASMVRDHLHTDRFSMAADVFAKRLLRDAATLNVCGERIRTHPHLVATSVLDDLQQCAHQLSGVAGIFGYHEVSVAASALERRVIQERASSDAMEGVGSALEMLLREIENTRGKPTTSVAAEGLMSNLCSH